MRALARDVGAALGVGAHLTALRRTRVGAFSLTDARTLDDLAVELTVVPLSVAVAAAFPRIDVSEEEAKRLGYGQPVRTEAAPPGPFGVFAPDGSVVALGEQRDGRLRTLVVFASAG